MIDTHSAESNEKFIFRFSFFELWLIVFTIVFPGGTPGFSNVSKTPKKSRSKVVKFTDKMRNELKR